MKIQNINYTSRNINFRNNNKKQKHQQPNTSPIQEGIKTAGVWLGFGLGFDYICRKCVVFKNSPVKNSLFLNSLLAILAGGVTTIKSLVKIKSQKVDTKY